MPCRRRLSYVYCPTGDQLPFAGDSPPRLHRNHIITHTDSDFTAMESVRAVHSLRDFRIIVHVSFKISGSEPDSLFVELIVPLFTVDDMKWDNRKKPYVEVRGCCLLKRTDSGKPFGRVCGICFDGEVIHPGPREGYSVVAGDDFVGYDFMYIGRGIY